MDKNKVILTRAIALCKLIEEYRPQFIQYYNDYRSNRLEGDSRFPPNPDELVDLELKSMLLLREYDRNTPLIQLADKYNKNRYENLLLNPEEQKFKIDGFYHALNLLIEHLEPFYSDNPK